MASFSYEMSGKVEKIMEVQAFNSGFTKREFVLLVDDRFPQHVKFQFVKEKCALLDNVKPGDEVKVTFSVNGREWQDKYFVDLQAFRLEKISEGREVEVTAPDAFDVDDMPAPSAGSSGNPKAFENVADDDLPF